MKRIIELSENDYMALKEDGVQNHLALADTVIAHSVLYKEKTTQDEWIPVSERLPKEGESVLVCLRTQGGISQYVSERFNKNCWSALGGRTPLAWRPLPEPYKEGGAE